MIRIAIVCTAFCCAIPSLVVDAQEAEKAKAKVLVKAKTTLTPAMQNALQYWAPPSQLVGIDEVMRNLKLDANQDKAVKKAIADHPDAAGAVPAKIADRKKHQEATQKLNDALKTALGDKMKRLDQIAAQGAGLPAYFTPARSKDLGLSAEQLAKSKELVDASLKEMQDKALKDGRKLTVVTMRLPENRTAFIDIATPKLLTLLSNEQNKKFLNIIGDPLQPEALLKVRTGTAGPPGLEVKVLPIKKLPGGKN